MNCEVETLGAHIRNALGPYAHIIALIENMEQSEETNDEKTFNMCKKLLYKSANNLEHLIDISKMPEVEAINWRATDLCKTYYQEKNNY